MYLKTSTVWLRPGKTSKLYEYVIIVTMIYKNASIAVLGIIVTMINKNIEVVHFRIIVTMIYKYITNYSL